MQAYQQKTHAKLLFLVDVLALAIAFAASYAALKAGLHVIQNYTAETMQGYLAMLFLSFLIVFLMQPADNAILKRTWQQEIGRIVRFQLLFALVFALLLFLIKSPVVDSRYLFVYTLALHALLTFVFHTVYKRVMRRAYAESSTVTLMGVVTTRARAESIIADVYSSDL